MAQLPAEIEGELERLGRSDFLTPQELALLRVIVLASTRGETANLYQKAIAHELGIADSKQVGVIASRLRTKLAEHYRAAPQGALVIELPPRGYVPRFVYRHSTATVDRVQGLIADARQAVDHFEIRLPADCSPEEIKSLLTELSNYYRACGGLGFVVELDAVDIFVQEPVGERR